MACKSNGSDKRRQRRTRKLNLAGETTSSRYKELVARTQLELTDAMGDASQAARMSAVDTSNLDAVLEQQQLSREFCGSNVNDVNTRTLWRCGRTQRKLREQ